MQFKEHSDLKGQHAILSPSNYHWVNYSPEKFLERLSRRLAQQRGSELHELAQQCITLGVKLPNTKAPLNRYVNDAIGYNMVPEQPLFYTYNAFGCADAISFKGSFLRIHDLKTGETRGSMNQLLIYAALFCLEYGHNPDRLKIELRIYQGLEIVGHRPEGEEVQEIIDKIVFFDKMIKDHS